MKRICISFIYMYIESKYVYILFNLRLVRQNTEYHYKRSYVKAASELTSRPLVESANFLHTGAEPNRGCVSK